MEGREGELLLMKKGLGVKVWREGKSIDDGVQSMKKGKTTMRKRMGLVMKRE